MGRYTGPVEKLSRREGVELFLKGERALNGKSALERRGAEPARPARREPPAAQGSRSTRPSCAPSRPPSATTAFASGSSGFYVKGRSTAHRA